MNKYVDKDGLQYFAEELTAKNKEIFAVKAEVGTPLVAATAAAMTDTSKIYVYTGSETGYTAGDWYYYDGSAWQSGGVYNSVAVQTDTSLSVSGMAADAKTVGDDLDALDGRLDTIEDDYATDSDLSDLEDTIAPAFSISVTYSVGDYVMKDGSLYKCIGNHSGSWNASHFEHVNVGGQFALFFALSYLNAPSIQASSENPVDLDNYTTVGNYKITTTAIANNIAHLPLSVGGRLYVFETSGSVRLCQLFIANVQAMYRLYVRSKHQSNAWSDWYWLNNTEITDAIATEGDAWN